MEKTLSTTIQRDQLAPPGAKGELHLLPIRANEERQDLDRLHDQSIREFRVVGLLSKSLSLVDTIKVDVTPNDGESYFQFPEKAVLNKVDCAGGSFEVKKNDRGEQALIEFNCRAVSANDARVQFQSVVLPFLDHLSFIADLPVAVSSIRIFDKKNDSTVVEYTTPYQAKIVNSHAQTLFLALAPVYAMYREAKNSNSDFYRFLCYYKILEGLLGKLRADAFIHARKRGIELDRPKERVPEVRQLSPPLRKLVGKPLRQFFDEVLTPRFRNAIAHFVTDDGAILNMSLPRHIDEYSEILFLTESCVRLVVQTHEKLVAKALS